MERAGTGTKLAFGVGQIAEGVKNAAFNVFLFFYYTQVLGLAPGLAGLALLVAVVCDAVTDPLAGLLSDATRSRFGRRHPWMYAAALPLAFTFAALFRPPEDLSQAGLFLWLTGFTVAVRTSMTLFHVPHMALGAELSTDYAERTVIVGWRTAFGFLGIFLVLVLPWSLFFVPSPEYPNGQLDPSGYPGFGVFFAVVMAVAVVASALGTHHRIPHLPVADPDDGPPGLRKLLRANREALRNPSFRALFLGLVVFFVTRGVQETLNLHMATYFWLLEGDDIRNLQIASAAGLLPGIPFWTRVSRRIDKKPTFLFGVALFSAFTLLPPLAWLLGAFPARESPAYMPTLAAMAALAAFGAAAAIVTAGSMMADIADEHELATGRRREGVFFGAVAFAAKSASGLGHGIAGLGVEAIGFPAQAEPGNVPAGTVAALGILYGPGIAVLAAAALAILTRYRLDHAAHARIAAALAERRARA